MSAVASVDRTAEMSPRTKGKWAGAVYLLYVIAGVYAQAFISDRLVVFSDAARTASNILANQSLYRLGLTFTWSKWPARSQRRCCSTSC